MFCNMYVANNSSILQYCHGMSIEGVLVIYRTIEYANSWKGRRKRKSSLLRPPPPLFFLKVGRKRGGGITAGQYSTCMCLYLRRSIILQRYIYTCMRLYLRRAIILQQQHHVKQHNSYKEKKLTVLVYLPT